MTVEQIKENIKDMSMEEAIAYIDKKIFMEEMKDSGYDFRYVANLRKVREELKGGAE